MPLFFFFSTKHLTSFGTSSTVILSSVQIPNLNFFMLFKHNWRLYEYSQGTLTCFYPATFPFYRWQMALHSNKNEKLSLASTVLCQISIKQTI